MKSLLFWIACSKLLVVAVILFAGIGLMPDEAQYWTWSKELSYGYYSKPMGIAWQIAAGCFIFGDTELGVRIGSVILSFFLSLAIYWLSRSCGLDHKKSYWATICFTYSPLGIFSAFFATTDCAYVLFWTVALALAVKDLTLSVGLVIALGALWKWPIYAVWIPISFFYYKRPWQLVKVMLISLLGLLPSLLWNIKTGFVTFQHVAASIDNVASRGNPLEFLGAQFALVSPVFFVLILYGLMRFTSKEMPLRLAWVTSVLFLGAIFLLSWFEKVQGNWAVAAYPTGFVIMMLYATRRWVIAGLIVSVLLIAATLFLPLPYKMNPMKQGLGNSRLDKALIASGYNLNRDFLFSDRYQVTSLLSFYGPEQKRAYFFNIHGLRHNQFDLWPQMKDERVGQSGYFVEICHPNNAAGDIDRLRQKLLPYFSEVTVLAFQTLYGQDKVAIILHAVHYNGLEPLATNKY